MPERPLRVCRCGALVRGACPKCKQARQARDQLRPNAVQRGYNNRWRRYAATYLRSHPLCVLCLEQGIRTRATCVDHKMAHRLDPQLMWDPMNHQALCNSCHSRKTAREDGGFGRGYGGQKAGTESRATGHRALRARPQVPQGGVAHEEPPQS